MSDERLEKILNKYSATPKPKKDEVFEELVKAKEEKADTDNKPTISLTWTRR